MTVSLPGTPTASATATAAATPPTEMAAGHQRRGPVVLMARTGSRHRGRCARSGAPGVVLDLVPQPAHVDRDRRSVPAVETPHMLQQLVPPERPPGMAHQVGQKLELLGRQLDHRATQAHLVGGGVQLQIPGTEAGRLRGASTAPLARRRTAFTRAVNSRGENGLAT